MKMVCYKCKKGFPTNDKALEGRIKKFGSKEAALEKYVCRQCRKGTEVVQKEVVKEKKGGNDLDVDATFKSMEKK